MCLPHQAVAGGPRATDRFAAVTAAFVSGLAGTTRAVEVTAFFLEAAALRLEEAVRVGSSTLFSLSAPCVDSGADELRLQ